MKVGYFPKIISKESTSLILGSFESFHNGHFELLKESQKSGLKTAIMLIKNPEDLPRHSKTLFQTFQERLRNVANLKIDYASIVHYDSQVALLDGDAFLKKIIKATNAKEIIVGKDFAMGKNRNLQAKDIKNVFKNVKVINFFKINNAKLSTSFLKELVFLGDFQRINQFCPKPYTKFLLINDQSEVEWQKSIVPQSGIYACFTIFKNMKYFSYLHINQQKESKLFTPNLNLKNETIILEIHKQIRVIARKSEDSVKEEDIIESKLYFKNI